MLQQWTFPGGRRCDAEELVGAPGPCGWFDVDPPMRFTSIVLMCNYVKTCFTFKCILEMKTMNFLEMMEQMLMVGLKQEILTLDE